MKIRTLLITGFSLLALIVALMQAASFRSLAALTEAEEWLTHSHKVISQARRVEKLLLDMVTGMRGYILTGEERYLEPYHPAVEEYPEVIGELKTLVSDHPEQVDRLTDIHRRIDHLHTNLLKPLLIHGQEETERIGEGAISRLDPEELALMSEEKALMDALREKLKAFIEVEQELLVERKTVDRKIYERKVFLLIAGSILFFLVAGITLLAVLRGVMTQVGGEPSVIAEITDRVAKGNLQAFSPQGGETGILASVGSMLEALKENEKNIRNQNWANEGIAGLYDVMRGNKNVPDLCSKVTSFLSGYVDAQVGSLSVLDPDGSRLVLAGGYAYEPGENEKRSFTLGEGLVGQAGLQKKRIIVRNVPEEGLRVHSALGEISPECIVCLPLLADDELVGVLELGAMHPFSDVELDFLDNIAERVAIAIRGAHAREQMKKLLDDSQAQTEELQTQQEELRVANEELDLKRQELETQQEELRVSNEELEEKNAELTARRHDKDAGEEG
jgi:CHASE3 domain sensor protein